MTKIVIDQLATLLARINDSEGARMWRHTYATCDGERVDLTKDGTVSCAVYVSTLLLMARKLPEMKATVVSLQQSMKEHNWIEFDEYVPGSVLIWEEAQQFGGEPHLHAGFYLGNKIAMSHSDQDRSPCKHHVTFGVDKNGSPVRRVTGVYVHPDLHNITM